MTSEEILNHEFESLSDDSYSKESVDAYLKEVGKSYDELFNENKEIVRRLTIFAKKLDEYKRNESYMTETLLTAQKTAAQTISGAESVVAKMIEAAKNEGKKIVNEARERSNAIYADRDKIIADAQKIADELTLKAQSAYDEAKADAEMQAKSIIDDAKSDLQKTIDEINGSADAVIKDAETAGEKIIDEAKIKAQAEADSIIAEANAIKADAEKIKAEAENFKNESFEMKKLAVLYKDEMLAKAHEDAEKKRQEASAFAHSVTSKAKAAAAGILLKAQADVNRINDELNEKTAAINAAFDETHKRYNAVRALADEIYGKLSSQLSDFGASFAAIPVEDELPETEPLKTDETAFVTDSAALNDAVAKEDIEAVLKCFGINSEDMLKATEQLIADEAERIKTSDNEPAESREQEKTENSDEEASDNVFDASNEIADNSDSSDTDEAETASEPSVQENIQDETPEEARNENVPEPAKDSEKSTITEKVSETENDVAQSDGDTRNVADGNDAEYYGARENDALYSENLNDDSIEDEFNFDLNFDDAERIPETGEAVDYIEIDDAGERSESRQNVEEDVAAEDIGIDTDMLFGDDNWEEISDFSQEDEVKEFVPELPDSDGEKQRFISEDEQAFEKPSDSTAGQDNYEAATQMFDDDFEIDFSMFEVNEEKKKAEETEKTEKSGNTSRASRKKKKKKK